MLQQQISATRTSPRPAPNTLYFVYLPPGRPVAPGGTRSCQAFCGYHNVVLRCTLFYAVCPSRLPGLHRQPGVLDALTTTSSHELCEAITDPIPGQGWYDDVNGEIGDICAWKTKKLGAWTVQLEWSNKKKACV